MEQTPASLVDNWQGSMLILDTPGITELRAADCVAIRYIPYACIHCLIYCMNIVIFCFTGREFKLYWLL